jgi:hypothetical protein
LFKQDCPHPPIANRAAQELYAAAKIKAHRDLSEQDTGQQQIEGESDERPGKSPPALVGLGAS